MQKKESALRVACFKIQCIAFKVFLTEKKMFLSFKNFFFPPANYE